MTLLSSLWRNSHWTLKIVSFDEIWIILYTNRVQHMRKEQMTTIKIFSNHICLVDLGIKKILSTLEIFVDEKSLISIRIHFSLPINV